MELIINLYQEKADQAIDDMLKAWAQYETTRNEDWLHAYLECEVRAICYLILLEEARTLV